MRFGDPECQPILLRLRSDLVDLLDRYNRNSYPDSGLWVLNAGLVEYLALVGGSVRRRHSAPGDRMGPLAYLAPRWGLTLAVFVLILGAGGWMMDQEFVEEWLFLNVVVAFLHYAYDGMIWHLTEDKARASHNEAAIISSEEGLKKVFKDVEAKFSTRHAMLVDDFLKTQAESSQNEKYSRLPRIRRRSQGWKTILMN